MSKKPTNKLAGYAALLAQLQNQTPKASTKAKSAVSADQMPVYGQLESGQPIAAYFEIFKASDGTLVQVVKLDGIQFKGFQVSTLRKLYDPGTVSMVEEFLAQVDQPETADAE